MSVNSYPISARIFRRAIEEDPRINCINPKLQHIQQTESNKTRTPSFLRLICRFHSCYFVHSSPIQFHNHLPLHFKYIHDLYRVQAQNLMSGIAAAQQCAGIHLKQQKKLDVNEIELRVHKTLSTRSIEQ